MIATNHRTVMHGQEYDPNKRIKRSAARAAQRIIDQIKSSDLAEMDEDEEVRGGVKVEADVEDEQVSFLLQCFGNVFISNEQMYQISWILY